MKNSLTILFLLFSSIATIGQNTNRIDSLKWHQYLDAAFKGSHDINTNKNTKISSKSGACKITFMNIQHRMNNKRINPNDLTTQKTAMDMTQMENAFDDSTQRTDFILISPEYQEKSITLKSYINCAQRDSIDIGVVSYIKQLNSTDSSQDGYYVYAFGVAAGFHLFHLLVHKQTTTTDWYLFDDFGINGEFIDLSKSNSYQNFSMTEQQVSNYLKKYLSHAAYIYKSSDKIKNPTTINEDYWNAYDRPLWTKFYVITE